MRSEKTRFLLVALAVAAFAGASFAQQQRIFNWLPANDESVRLDPANYHSGRTYHPGPNGGNMHVDIKSRLPLTIFMADADSWSAALQHPEQIAGMTSFCALSRIWIRSKNGSPT